MLDYRRIFRLRLGRRAELRAELDEELTTHIELRVDELVARGMGREEAMREARKRFGDFDEAKRELYSSVRRREVRLRWGRMLDSVGRDVRLAFRRMVKSPGFAVVSISILGLAISLTTVMFTLVDGVLLRPLPFPEPERLVSLESVGEGSEDSYAYVSMANWHDWRAGTTTLAATGISEQGRISVGIGGDAFRVTGTSVGGDFFQVFQPTLMAGRPLTMEDGQAINQVTVLASSFATRHFGSPDDALGRTLTISGRPYEVVGVVDEHTAHPERSDLWVAFHVAAGNGAARNNINFQAFGRLKEGVDVDRARSELDAVASGIRATDPEGAFHSHGVGVVPLQQALVSDVADTLWLLMLAVVAVLFVACANLAGLGLAGARRRTGEVSLRLALGCGRRQVIRQLLVEYLAIAAIGGALGLTLAWTVGDLILGPMALELPRGTAVRLDLRVALFTAGLTIGAGLLAGIAPAVRISRSADLTGGSRRHLRVGRSLPGGTLVAIEVALALAILIGGGLLLRSLQVVAARDLGYDPAGVVVVEVDLNGEEYRSGTLAVEYWRTLLDNLEQHPGVQSAAVANWIPTGDLGTGFVALPHDPEPDFGASYRVVSEGFFETLEIAVLRGRAFDPSDGPGTERVALVNRALADRAWPGSNPIGQRIASPSMEAWLYDGEAPWLSVIGVVDDIRHDGYESDNEPELYVLYRQVPRWTRGMNVVVRGLESERATLSTQVGEAIRASNPALAVETSRLDDRVANLLQERVLTQRILAGFGVTALLLMCLGVYGLVAHAVSQRTREIAVRAALGARSTGLLGLILGGAGRVIGVGTAIGLAVAYGLTGLLDSLLIDVPATDPATFLAAAALLVTVGMLAALIPSVRAARMDPSEALRGE